MNTDFKQEMHEAFGELTAQQLWVLTKFAKNVRLRCRNNTAFNNFMNRTFPYAQFKQVNKIKASGETYPGLSIQVKEHEISGEED